MRELAFGTALLLTACGEAQAERVTLSGERVARVAQVGAFDKVELEGPDTVRVRVGGAQSVAIEGDRAIVDRLEVVVEDGKLVVRRKGRNWNVGGRGEIATVTVTVPRLAAAAVGGSGEMSVDRVGGGDFEAAVGGSGRLDVGEVTSGKLEAAVGGSGSLRFAKVEADSVELAIGGSGTIAASGRARAIEASVGGSGNVEAQGLATRTADVSMAGSGNVAVNASDTASISIAGSGDVMVGGGARCRTSKIGSGKVRCGATG